MTFSKSFIRESNLDNALATKVNHVNLSPFVPTVANGDITLQQYAELPWQINKLYVKTASGTCSITVKIDGTAVTGMNGVSVSSTETEATATANRVVAAGETVTITVASNVDAVDLSISVIGELT